MIDAFRRDLRYAARSLRGSPAFSVTAVLVLALGIGMTSAMFTVFKSVLLTREPARDPDRIVELSGVAKGAATEFPLLPAQLRRFRAQSRTLQDVAGLAHWRVIDTPLNDGDRQIVLREAVVTENFFETLGASPAIGRLFHPGDSREWGALGSGGAIAVLSYDAWRRVFGGDPSIVGHHVLLPRLGWSVMIVGVAPPGLDYPRGVEYWMASEYGSLDVVGRLAPGATPETARNEFLAFLDHDPDLVRTIGAHTLGSQVHTLDAMTTGEAKPALLALSGAVGLLLLLACANVGNLLLLRAAGRVREMAIRRAIGATAADLVRQLLTESVVIALAGGLLGLGLARLFLAGLIRLAPAGLPRPDLIVLAGTPLATSAIVTMATAILFGVVPSLATLRFDLSSPLHSDTRSGTEGRRLRKIRQGLVASQIALAVVVLAGAGLLARSLARLTDLDMGFQTDHLAMLSVALPWKKMASDCRPQEQSLTAGDTLRWSTCSDKLNFDAHDRIMAQLRTVPGILSASPETAPPFLGSNVWMGKFVAEGQSDADGDANPWFGYDLVGPEFFQALDAPILEGRGFTEADREGSPLVAVITDGVARRLWPNQDAVGKRFHETGKGSPDSLVTVVGVTRDFHYRQHREATPTVFRPFRQVYAQGYFVIKTRGDPSASFAGMRRAVQQAGAGATFVQAQSMRDLIAPQLAGPRFDALLLAIFALAALVLASVGLYGIMASSVSQQTRELGVRMALGATPGGLQNMVLAQAVVVAVAGIVVGLIGAVAGSRLLTALLFGISPFDPVTLAGVAVVLLVVAVTAAFLPARRATRVDPVQALRAE